MPLYIYQAAYTPASVAAQIREPEDRFEAIRPAFEAMGVKIVVGGHPFNEGGTARREAIGRATKSLGGTLEAFYYASGDGDV